MEAVFEGDPRGVERLVGFAEKGPPAAHVEQVETFDAEIEGVVETR